MTHAETTSLPDVTRRSGETPLAWLVRIAPDDWEVTEEGYGLVFQSERGAGDRRVVVDPLEERVSFEERVETDGFGERWHQRETTGGRWYIRPTAGPLLWGVDGKTAENIDAPENTDVHAGTERGTQER